VVELHLWKRLDDSRYLRGFQEEYRAVDYSVQGWSLARQMLSQRSDTAKLL
jgi:hypothetical protein